MTQIPALGAMTTPAATQPQNRFSEMKSEDFIRIIFTELTNQDPFSPNDSAALLEQLNSIRSIESDMTLTTQLQALVLENQIASAGNLIGKVIGGLTQDSQRVAGYVVSVLRQGDSVLLELDNGWQVPVSNVETIIDPAILADAAPPAAVEGNSEAPEGSSPPET
jgi:flagellar basal-body rod modification protein FlgD